MKKSKGINHAALGFCLSLQLKRPLCGNGGNRTRNCVTTAVLPD